MTSNGFLYALGRDLRYALRSLRGSPGLTAAAVLTLAIGSGAATATFAIVNSVLLEPLAYPDADRVVAIYHEARGAAGYDWASNMLTSASMVFTYADESRVFEQIGVWTPGEATVTGDGEPEEVPRIAVGAGTLEALAVSPLLGRSFGAAEFAPGDGTRTVMLGYGYWQRRFGGDPAVVGRTMTLNDRSMEIIGIMPDGFRIADKPADVLLAMRFDRATQLLGPFSFYGIARLKPGKTIADANADIARMLPIWQASWPPVPGVDARTYTDEWRIAPSARPLKQDVVGQVSELLWLVMATIGVVLLIACANVANLMLIRSAARQHELAIRAALGAGTGRLSRGLALEGVTVGVVAGVLGLVIAATGLRSLLALAPANLPRLSEVALDAKVVTATLAVSALAGLAVGLVSAARVGSTRLNEGLHAGGRTSSEGRGQRRLQHSLVIAQVALVVVVLVSAGLLIRTVIALSAVDPGFTGPEHVQTLRISLRKIQDMEAVARRQQEIVDALAALPGVSAVGFAMSVPMDPSNQLGGPIEAEGRPVDARGLGATPRRIKGSSPGLLAATGIRLLAGRDLAWADLYDTRPVVLISENMARELWTAPQLAVGKRIRLDQDALWREVVGVVADVREDGLRAPAPSIVYRPSLWRESSPDAAIYGQVQANRSVVFAVRSSLAGTEAFPRQVQEAVWSVDPSLPIIAVRTLREIYDQSSQRTTFTLMILLVAACAALALGVVGLYGVLSYTVSLRRREIAIRLALGADQRSVRRRFVRHGVTLAGIGIAIGVVAAAAAARLIASLLYGVRPIDALTYVTVAVGLTLVAALASYLPARRASVVDPAESLAAE
ncbi:MAG TPA: ABC transporter permease [Gammaproteobacteria bacterium]|nr:ABC transporter permease [Gammaproteobacteria bacterium]